MCTTCVRTCVSAHVRSCVLLSQSSWFFWERGANLEILHLNFKIKDSRGVGKVCKVLVSARSEGPCPSTNHTDQLSQYCHKHLAIIGSLLLSGSADPRPHYSPKSHRQKSCDRDNYFYCPLFFGGETFEGM